LLVGWLTMDAGMDSGHPLLSLSFRRFSQPGASSEFMRNLQNSGVHDGPVIHVI
jgi:hypothetical protein